MSNKSVANTPVLDIMVPTHSRLDLTIQCIESIYRCTHNPFHLIVIDDSEVSKPPPPYTPLPAAAKIVEPWDATSAWMTEFVHWHNNVTYFQANTPFISGNQFFNAAIKQMKTPYLATVMNSMNVQPDWDVEAMKLMQSDPKIGVVGFKCVFPDTHKIECAGIALHEGYLPIDIGRDLPSHMLTQIYEVQAIQWAFALVRKEAVEGNLDETLFNGFKGWDDIDNCFVVKSKGWKIFYCGFGMGIHHPRATRGDNTVDGYLKNKENAHKFYKRWGLWEAYKESNKMDVSDKLSLETKTNLAAVITEYQMTQTLFKSREATLKFLVDKALKDECGVDPVKYTLGMNPASNQWDVKEKLAKPEVKTEKLAETIPNEMPAPVVVAKE